MFETGLSSPACGTIKRGSPTQAPTLLNRLAGAFNMDETSQELNVAESGSSDSPSYIPLVIAVGMICCSCVVCVIVITRFLRSGEELKRRQSFHNAVSAPRNHDQQTELSEVQKKRKP